jgi:rhodanese-related sulfurtransferase
MPTLPPSPVADVPALSPSEAKEHFARLLALETDCWDVHASLDAKPLPFVLLDVRSPEHFRRGHVPGALNLPHRQISPRTVEELPSGKLLVVYCAGPHCNGADRAALKLAALGRPVKKMIGGVTGWRDEGFSLVEGA